MKYIYFVLAIINYLIFAWDIENDRDFTTWMWLGVSIYFALNSYLHYKKDQSFGKRKN